MSTHTYLEAVSRRFFTIRNGNKETVLQGCVRNLPRKLVEWLFGENMEILVLTPGQSIESVEIHEIKKGA